ncbi:MAG TPA: COX15/CtaA family protein [Oligoflexia bacterium]|mgnify:CR=1 FL=1|nr:COX15/CtaA family protein [Oligoflexia bacterium]HMP47449.1 COX15/CtaA family protein [Oligoflexia bacterium]
MKIAAVLTFILTVFVVLWGALVRATHSGAGCGAHWPLCNGDVVPLAPSIETFIEFTHRITSGFSALVVFLMLIVTFCNFPRGTFVRSAIFHASVFMLVEVGIGASLVLYGWVLYDSSVSRAVMVAFHLINSFLLVGTLSVYVWTMLYHQEKLLKGFLLMAGSLGDKFLFVVFLMVGSAGAVTALGDTLFPALSLLEGIREDFSRDSHFLVQLRVIHPVLAILLSVFLLNEVSGNFNIKGKIGYLSKIISGAVALQVFLGTATVLLLAPVYLQIFHLFISLVIWSLFVFYVTEKELVYR